MDVTMAEWFNGDKIELTGKTLHDAGAEWEEFIWLEGPKKGKKGIRPTKAELARNAARVKKEREDMRSFFRRLHVNAGTLPPK